MISPTWRSHSATKLNEPLAENNGSTYPHAPENASRREIAGGLFYCESNFGNCFSWPWRLVSASGEEGPRKPRLLTLHSSFSCA